MDEKTQSTLEFIAVIAELVAKYGVPAVLRIIKLWNVDEPELEEIRALKKLIKPPEMYFEDTE